MKFELETEQQAYQINDYQVGQYLRINHKNYDHALILNHKILENWQVKDFKSLNKHSFKPFLAHQPDVIILGTGENMQFPDPAFYAELINHNIGIEVMNTAAACRTYTVLISEHRRVLAALLL